MAHEQGRAPALLVHHPELAREATDQLQAIVELIAATTTTKGLTVRSVLDEHKYEKGRTVSDADMATLNFTPGGFHGEWNYTIRPRP